MPKTGNRRLWLAALAAVKGLAQTRFNGRSGAATGHGGGAGDGRPVRGQGHFGRGSMTYRLDAYGKQYVVLSAGGHSALQNKQGGHAIAYALP